MFDDFLKNAWAPFTEGGIDGDNLNKDWLFGPDQDVVWQSGNDRAADGRPTRRVRFPLLDKAGGGTIHRKGPDRSSSGVEVWLKTSDATDGKLCLVDERDRLKRQILSLYIDQADGVASPAGYVDAGYGDLVLRRAGTTKLTVGASATTHAQVQTWSAGLGDVTHIQGPTDQSLNLIGDGNDIVLARSDAGAETFVVGLDVIKVRDADANTATISPAALTTDRTFSLPDATGTFALTSDLAAYQPLDSDLTAIAALTTTAHGRGLLDDADAAASRTSLGLGTMAVETATDYAKLGANNTWGAFTQTMNNTDTIVKLGTVQFNVTLATASSGGTTTVAAKTVTVFVDASALTAAQNHTVSLPSAVTYQGKVVSVKVTVVGAATSTITVSASAGNVEGGATRLLDASARTTESYISDGTDWWRVD